MLGQTVVSRGRIQIAYHVDALYYAPKIFRRIMQCIANLSLHNRRADSVTIEVNRIMPGRLVLAGQNLTFDELASNWDEFSFRLLSSCLMSHLGLTSFDEDSLRTLGLVLFGGGCVNATEVFSSKNGFSAWILSSSDRA